MSTTAVAIAASNDRPLLKKATGISSIVPFFVDLAAVQAAAASAFALHFGLATLQSGDSSVTLASHSVAAAVLPVIFAAIGLYPGHVLGPVRRLQKRFLSTFLVFSTLIVWTFALHNSTLSPLVLTLTMLLFLVLAPFCDTLSRGLLMQWGAWGTAVAVVGATETGRQIIAKLKNDTSLGLLPIALIDDNPKTWGTFIDGVPVIGPLSTASTLSSHVQIAILPSGGMEAHRLLGMVESLAFPTVLMLPDLHGLQSLWTVSRDLGGVIGLELRKNLLVPANRAIKRAIDCALAVPFFLASLPIILLSALWIKLVSPGPAFFRQKREGRHGKIITVLKLRTMYPNADELLKSHLESSPEARLLWSRYFKLRKDPRVLPMVGSLLRRFSLDELPQLWNVLKGDMSLVGPRPFPYYHLEGFSESFRLLRRSVTPGITGLWQVSERSDGDLSAQEAQDTYYIRNWSLWFDIYLLTRTVGRVMMPKGAY